MDRGTEILRREVALLNAHLPRRRRSLGELMREERAEIRCRDGRVHRIHRDELEYLAALIPPERAEQLMLPIFIELTPHLGRGAARISGELECEVVGKILGAGERSLEQMVIYRPDVWKVRRRLPSATQYAFIAAGGE